MPSIETDIDIDVSSLKESISDLSVSMGEFVGMMREQQTVAEENYDRQTRMFRGLSDHANDMQREQIVNNEKVQKSVREIVTEYDKWIEKIRRDGSPTQKMLAEIAPDQLMGATTGVKALKSSILKELPFGGLIGLMVLGGKRLQEAESWGAQVARIFKQTGDAGAGEFKRIGAIINNLSRDLGKGPGGMLGEVSAAATAFATAGTDIEDVLNKKFRHPINLSTGSILEASVAMDSMFKLGAGTSARMMGQMARDFNLSAEQSSEALAGIAFKARDAGTSVSTFMTSVMQSSAVLRTQRVDLAEVADAQIKLQKVMEGYGLDKQAAAAYSESAIQGMAQGLAGLSVGLTTVLGERITARTGMENVTGLDAYYALREGFQGFGQTGEAGGMFKETIFELTKLAKEQGRTPSEQKFFLERMGLSQEASRALIDMGANVAGGLEIDKLSKEQIKELRNSFSDRQKEVPDTLREIHKAQQGVARIGAGLLGTTISGFQSLINAAQLISAKMAGDDESERIYERALEISSRAGTRAMRYGMSGFEMIGQAAGNTFQDIMGFGAGDSVERAKLELSREGKSPEALRRLLGEARDIQIPQASGGIANLLKSQYGMEQGGDLASLLKIYREEESTTGRGEEALFKKLIEGGIAKERMRSAFMRDVGKIEASAAEQNITVPNVGQIKVKTVLEVVESGNKGAAESN